MGMPATLVAPSGQSHFSASISAALLYAKADEKSPSSAQALALALAELI